MKLQFKHQKFQADAAKAVVDVFAGQPYLTPTYMMDRGYGQQTLTDDTDFTGWRNERIVPELSDKLILEHLQKVQRTNQIKPSDKLEGRYNLTIEMETGVGKTYTYIKTMYELNKHYQGSVAVLHRRGCKVQAVRRGWTSVQRHLCGYVRGRIQRHSQLHAAGNRRRRLHTVSGRNFRP